MVQFANLGYSAESPSLRGSGLKFLRGEKIRGMKRSPSLRGSGLKSEKLRQALEKQSVSLFTREWIEIGYRNAPM